METKVNTGPRVVQLQSGTTLKVFGIAADSGMEIAKHYSTKEAVLAVQEGRALLHIAGKEHLLKRGDVFILPEKEVHSLTIQEQFQGLVTMPLESTIAS